MAIVYGYGFCLGVEGSETTSAEFSDVFHHLFGDGICPYGARFNIEAGGTTMRLTIGTGYAFVAGRWCKVTEATQLVVPVASNNYDRYDAVVLRANLASKEVELLVVQGRVAAIPDKYVPVRNDEVYELVLYNVFVGMGVTGIGQSNVEDVRRNEQLCGYVTTLQDVAGGVLKVYDYLVGNGITEKIDDVLLQAQNIMLSCTERAEAIVEKADNTVADITAAMDAASVNVAIGTVEYFLKAPSVASGWLLCDGSAVPSEYPALSALVDGVMPNIQSPGRTTAYMYAGQPVRT